MERTAFTDGSRWMALAEDRQGRPGLGLEPTRPRAGTPWSLTSRTGCFASTLREVEEALYLGVNKTRYPPVSRQICVPGSDAEPLRSSLIRRGNSIRNRDKR